MLWCTILSPMHGHPDLWNRHVPTLRSNPGPAVRAALVCVPGVVAVVPQTTAPVVASARHRSKLLFKSPVAPRLRGPST